MTMLPFGTDITLSQAPAPTAAATPTIVGVIGLAGAGASGAATDHLHLVHSLAEALTLVGTDGELHNWANEYYSRDTGEVLIGVIAAYTANDDTDRGEKASAALDLFSVGTGAAGTKASIIDIHNYGTNVATAALSDASTIVAKAETIAEQQRMMIYANFPYITGDSLTDWSGKFQTWLGNNRKARVLPWGGSLTTAANANNGAAASTVAVALRAALDGDYGVSMPIANKPVTGIVSAAPAIPYSLNRSAATTGRTLQQTHGASFIANYRGWHSVQGLLATSQASDQRAYESILRSLDIAEDRWEAAIEAHLGQRNRAVERALLQLEMDTVTSQLIVDGILQDAEFTLRTDLNRDNSHRVTLSGTARPVGVIWQVDIYVEVTNDGDSS